MEANKELEMVSVRPVPEYKLYSETALITSEDAVKLLQEELAQYDREVFCVLHLNAKNYPISASITSIGEINSTLVHPREVFKSAVLASAAGIVLLHNHPSGDPNPSQDDIEVTRRLVFCGELMGIRVVDHIVCGSRGRFCSVFEFDKNEGMNQPIIELPAKDKSDMSSMVISRKINGHETEITLTKEEMEQAYFAQEKIWDEEYVRNYLRDKDYTAESRAAFRAEFGFSAKSVLQADAAVSKLAADMRRNADKYGMNDLEGLEEALSEERQRRLQKRKSRQKER
ncbi:MAG: JAB domain-containing protein [Anaerovoracaceae bacterium]